MLRTKPSLSILAALPLLLLGAGGADAQDYYQGEITLYVTPYCPAGSADVTGHPPVGAAPLSGTRYCQVMQGPKPQPSGEPAFEAALGQLRLLAAPACPAGHLEADGRAIDVENHRDLYALIGPRFGNSSPGTFRLPDVRQAAPPGLRYCLASRGYFPTGGIFGLVYRGSLLLVPLPGGDCPKDSVDADGREVPIAELVHGSLSMHPLFFFLETRYGGTYKGSVKPTTVEHTRRGDIPVYPTFGMPDVRKAAPWGFRYCLVSGGIFPHQ